MKIVVHHHLCGVFDDLLKNEKNAFASPLFSPSQWSAQQPDHLHIYPIGNIIINILFCESDCHHLDNENNQNVVKTNIFDLSEQPIRNHQTPPPTTPGICTPIESGSHINNANAFIR